METLLIEVQGGGVLEFRTQSELIEFVEKESSKWTWLQHVNYPQVHGAGRQFLQELQRLVEAASRAWDGTGWTKDPAGVQTAKGEVIRWWLPSNHSWGQLVLSLRAQGDLVSGALWFALVSNPSALSADSPEKVTALAVAGLLKSGLAEKWAAAEASGVEEIKRTWQAFDSQSRTTIAERDSRYAALATRVEEQVEAWEEEAAKRIKNLEELHAKSKERLTSFEQTYSEKLALTAPVAYWASEAESHGKKVKSGWCRFGVGLGMLACGAGCAWFLYVENFLTENPDEAHFVVGAFVFLLALGLWPLRIFSKELQSHIHLKTDAKQRVVATNAYLALLKEKNALQEQDRKLILDVLFRPPTIGMVNEEGAASVSVLLSKLLAGERK